MVSPRLRRRRCKKNYTKEKGSNNEYNIKAGHGKRAENIPNKKWWRGRQPHSDGENEGSDAKSNRQYLGGI